MEEGGYRLPLSFVMSRQSMSRNELDRMHPHTSTLSSVSRTQDLISTSQPRPLQAPTRAMVSPLQNLLPSAPASPPTPAPSPTPHILRLPSWSTASENEDTFLRDARPHFSQLDSQERQRFLAEILNLCDSQQLSFVLNYVSPRLKKDPFKSLPNELCLRV
jgi:F-box and WD-40 domain protein CDC4